MNIVRKNQLSCSENVSKKPINHEAGEEEFSSNLSIESLDNADNSGGYLDLHSACLKYNGKLIAHKKFVFFIFQLVSQCLHVSFRSTDDLLPKPLYENDFTAHVGRVGEELAYRYLLTTYENEITSKTLSVTWVNRQRESGLPYDILLKYHTADSVNAEDVYVEVKATSSVSKGVFEISNAEWRFAQLQV
jgi:hypothetical protein